MIKASAHGSKSVHEFASNRGNRTACGINLYRWNSVRPEVATTCKKCLKH